MKDQQAANFFGGKERYNCAQAVFKTFQQEAALPESVIEAAKARGGGKAPEGLCGAIYAAGVVASDDATRRVIETAFADVAGSIKCREIRTMKRVDCRGCVALASGLVEIHDQQLMGHVDAADSKSFQNQP